MLVSDKWQFIVQAGGSLWACLFEPKTLSQTHPQSRKSTHRVKPASQHMVIACLLLYDSPNSKAEVTYAGSDKRDKD